ncbi:hypothetical protein BBK36DRAFT_1170996 [Trichoderma citrinoviride]|uniref:mRNA splicing factor RNA helicase n=1 Tax=Trichoderma citrinoviride TaxID=58853 RepID=A0A2T4B511_9HYPO|nr:hypothetical protein BBK36DRAFT_1170996 [Trichoderma citrinoviride]PTB64426.1 hypothetical protein BBK36DRAFT_1170996 [Trichoderma citrinoviride]
MDENAPTDQQDGTIPTTIEPIRFRAGKKRKAGYRQRTAEEEDKNPDAAIQPAPVLPGASTKPGADDELGRRDVDDDDAAGAEATTTTHAADVDMGNANGDNDDDDDHRDNQSESESAVAAALRLRNARRAARRGGVGFRSEGRPGLNDGEDEDGEHALVLREQDKDHERIVGGITNRFMHQTGLLTILDDKHMNAYIESRLTSRNATDPRDPSSSSSQRPASQAAADALASGDPAEKWRDQPTRHGKLVEVDMSALDGGNGTDHNNKRRRIDKDTTAKPPPRRGRNRRNSEDIARDALVEQFLHENRLDVYDVPSNPFTQPAAASSSSAPAGADPSADDRLAEQFRQQYYTEQALRRKKKRPVTQQQQLKQQKQQAGEILKGPKLGGSRNMRAAVRDMLLQQEKEKRGK